MSGAVSSSRCSIVPLLALLDGSSDMDKKRIVFLSAKSGGGHDGAARSLIKLIEARYPGRYVFDVVDIYSDSRDQALPFLAQIRHHSDLIWRLFLWITNNRFFVTLARWVMSRYMIGQIRKQIPADSPIDLLVAVHFNPAQGVRRISKNLPGCPRTVIVATDYDPHWSWIGEADAIVVASESGEKKALAVGYRPEQVLRLEVLPNEQACAAPSPDSQVFAEGGRFRMLMVSGQDGSNPKKILAIVEALDRSAVADKITLDVVCGKNAALKQLLDARLNALKKLVVRVHGFVPGLHQKIAQSHLIIMRASPQILSECISAGVPVVAFDWSVHEQYQAEMINRQQLGFASKNTSAVLAYLQEMVTSSSTWQRHKSCTVQLAATFDADRLLQHVLQGERYGGAQMAGDAMQENAVAQGGEIQQ